MTKIQSRHLRLGDRIKCGAGADYSTATVKAIDPEFVTLFRPYVHTGMELVHTDGTNNTEVICYIGIEEFKVYRDSDTLWTVFNR